jgi:hypothetical protein
VQHRSCAVSRLNFGACIEPEMAVCETAEIFSDKRWPNYVSASRNFSRTARGVKSKMHSFLSLFSGTHLIQWSLLNPELPSFYGCRISRNEVSTNPRLSL